MVELNSLLINLSKQLIVKPVLKSRIEVSIAHLKENIWGLFQEKIMDVVLFGSFDRETFIEADQEADVDILVIFKQREFQPDTYLSQIRSLCEKKYSRSDIYPNHPTIVIDMEHIKFEIVPSYNFSSTMVKIPAPRSKDLRWISSSPKEFKNNLIKKDNNNKGLILPIIRIIKYWNSLNGHPFTSYELERFIVSKVYSGLTLRDYFYSTILSVEEVAKTELQKKSFASLKEKCRRLKILETYKLPEYIESELNSFLPNIVNRVL